MKLRLIEQLNDLVMPQCKNDKDIKMQKHFLCNYMALLCGFTYSEEGQKQILKLKQTFELAMFILDTLKLPQDKTPEITMQPLQQLLSFILLFIRNATYDNRANKVHFMKQDEFLPNLVSYLSSSETHPLIRCMTAAVLWTLVHNHQGIKAAINKQAIVSELQIMKSEFQREVDKASFLTTLNDSGASVPADRQKLRGMSEYKNDYHANLSIEDSAKAAEQTAVLTKDMNQFMSKALQGVLTIIQA